MELNYWPSTTATSDSYDQAAGEWTVVVDRDGQKVVLRPKQLVLATGMAGKPGIPALKGQDIFRSEQQHSSQHPCPDVWRSRRVVVSSANNSAHDTSRATPRAIFRCN